MMQARVARQAIFDRERRVFGYELLFRSSDWNGCAGGDATANTTQLLGDSFLSIGLNQLVGHKKAFVNFGREMLLHGFASALPRERMVIEILESVAPDQDVLAVCKDLRGDGYLLALDDFVVNSGQERFLEHAHIVKVEVGALPFSTQEELVRNYHQRGLKMLAEKVESPEDYNFAHRIGYDYFQGFFFARPTVVQSKRIPTSKLNCIHLLQEIARKDPDLTKLAELISSDVGLLYKLLRYVNSALFAASFPIESAHHALMYLGEDKIRKWVAMAALPKVAFDKTPELLTVCLVRAHMSELTARLSGYERPDQAFLMGLLSLLDVLLDRPLDSALAEVQLAAPIPAVLLGTAPETEMLAVIYDLVRRFEAGDWDGVEESANRLSADGNEIQAAYQQAVVAAERAVRQVNG